MTTLLLGFVALVILPALILAVVFKRFFMQPVDMASFQEENEKFSG